MKQSKQTKRALLTSVLAMLLCLTMLVGSTFAWFTDSVTTGVNKIVAGNLDVELYAKKTADADYAPVTTETNLFMEETLWEPGHVEVINLKVANLGTLALKYLLGVNIASETPSTNVHGNPLKLSDHIMFAVVEGKVTYKDRADAIAAAEDAGAVSISAFAETKDGTLYPAKETADPAHPSEREVTLIVYMPTTVGNDANYMTGKAAPQIHLGVKLVATQARHESDSFGPEYDDPASYPVLDSKALKSALESGGNVTLAEDVNVAPVLPDDGGKELISQMNVTEDTHLDLSGKTLGVEANGDLGSHTPALIGVTDGATLTIDGNGVINAEAGNNNSYGINVEGGTLIINSGTFYGAPTAVQVKTGTVIINGGFFDLAPTVKGLMPNYAKYMVNAIDDNYKDGTAVVEITGGTFVNFDPSANPEGANTSYVPAGYDVVPELQENGDTWYTVVKSPSIDEGDAEDPWA